jgi:hypothetical protein
MVNIGYCGFAIYEVGTKQWTFYVPNEKSAVVQHAVWLNEKEVVFSYATQEKIDGRVSYQIASYNIENATWTSLNQTDTSVDGLALSSDGQHIAYMGRTPCSSESNLYCTSNIYVWDRMRNVTTQRTQWKSANVYNLAFGHQNQGESDIFFITYNNPYDGSLAQTHAWRLQRDAEQAEMLSTSWVNLKPYADGVHVLHKQGDDRYEGIWTPSLFSMGGKLVHPVDDYAVSHNGKTFFWIESKQVDDQTCSLNLSNGGINHEPIACPNLKMPMSIGPAQ